MKNSAKKIFTILLVIVVILMTGVSLFGRNAFSPPPAPEPTAPPEAAPTPAPAPITSAKPAPAQTFIVSYNASGFFPPILSVRQGDTVNFMNQTSDSLWVASNPHPTHTDWPEFDAKKGYARGTSYSFTFSKIGSWGYHNHLNPARGGTVNVE